MNERSERWNKIRTVFLGKKEAEGEGMKFSSLLLRSLPEMISFQIITKAIVFVLAGLIGFAAKYAASANTTRTFTNTNIKVYFTSWQGYLLILAGIAVTLLYITFDIMAQMELCNDILTGNKDSLFTNIKQGFQNVRKLLDPGGISIILYILMAVPLCGIGFSTSLTSNQGFPEFMMQKVTHNIPLFIFYYGGILLLMVLGFMYIFSVQGVIIDGLKAKEAKRQSIRIMKKNWKHFVVVFLINYAVVRLITLAAYYLFRVLPPFLMQKLFSGIPDGTIVNIDSVGQITERSMIRFFTCFVILLGLYLYFIVSITGHSYLMLLFTRLYRRYRFGDEVLCDRPGKVRFTRTVVILLTFVAILAASAVMTSIFRNYIVYGEPVKIVAHRAGGNAAPENSSEGTESSVGEGIHGSEIDVQRTKDGEYVVCHDGNLKNLTGFDAKVSDLTLEEIKRLRIKGSVSATIPTLKEVMDAAKDRLILYIELKGATADTKMAEDVVAMLKERGQEKEAAVISMKYDLVRHVETKYPEITTGFIYYSNYGNINMIPCDMLIMEEDIATFRNISAAHFANKSVVVWTVNNRDLLYKMLNSQAYEIIGGNVDAVITDEIPLAKEVQKELDERGDIMRIRDAIYELDI